MVINDYIGSSLNVGFEEEVVEQKNNKQLK